VDDHRRQHRFRQVGEQRRQRQHGDEAEHCRDDRRQLGPGAREHQEFTAAIKSGRLAAAAEGV
jgi:hypothetical protein